MSMAAPVISRREMRGGQLIIDGDAAPGQEKQWYVRNSRQGAWKIIATFEKVDRRVIPEWNITADVDPEGDIANREKVP